MIATETRKAAPGGEDHAVRTGVPSNEKLLLVAILLIVAVWITFRMMMPLFAGG